MYWEAKTFEQLALDELYHILQSRVAVFVVEQNCAYPEVDGIDQTCVHLFAKEGDEVVAYARLIPKGVLDSYASIGRIMVNPTYRAQGYGRKLVDQAIRTITEDWKENQIKIHAQVYLLKFYQSFGFKPISDHYLEDDIMHVDMLFEKSKNLN
ncbi:GNAT family N-acetyltransferase [Amphibacillus jilinensis]|uniref:GNAT family N-acetyltransferase n=1 Tax=Amphibacillus jilinensis TaxID=1216008 RepID=UPI0002F6E2DE|nr:GNAT family N-acetyltransferase [Amphibacillus jilinensis]